MTDNNRNALDQSIRYRAPQVKVVKVNVQGILCLSDPSLTGWGNGSNSNGGDMNHTFRTLLLAFHLCFNGSFVVPNQFYYRHRAYSVRLVTEC